MELLDLWHPGDVRHQLDYQKEHCLCDWTASGLDAREQMDDDRRLRRTDDGDSGCVPERPGARQVGAEFWRPDADADSSDSDPAAFHNGWSRESGELPPVFAELAGDEHSQHQCL